MQTVATGTSKNMKWMLLRIEKSAQRFAKLSTFHKP